MLSEKDLRELIDYSPSTPVISVYLNTEPAGGNADAYRLRLRTMLKNVDLPQDVAAIERYFEHEYNWSGRGVAIFSNASEKFFKVYPLAVPVQNLVHVGYKPSIRPLTDLLDSYGGYGVVLVDKQGARLFNFHLGELREQEGYFGEAIRKIKRGSASSFPGRRGGQTAQNPDVAETVERNLKDIVEVATEFFEENHVRRVLLGGTDDNLAQFRSLMPKSWQSLVVGSFSVSMTASHLDVLERAMQVGLEAELGRERKLVDQLITAAAKNSGGVVGLEETLQAVNEGRVQTLAIVEGFFAPGFRCGDCKTLTMYPENCASCEGEVEPIQDVVNFAISAVIRTGGEIEVIHENEAFEKVGSIGAFLRY